MVFENYIVQSRDSERSLTYLFTRTIFYSRHIDTHHEDELCILLQDCREEKE